MTPDQVNRHREDCRGGNEMMCARYKNGADMSISRSAKPA